MPGIPLEYNSRVDESASFGYWVRRRRKALDLTQRLLADLVGCALITLKKIELDERRPSTEMAERLADALQLSVAERDAFVSLARGRLPAADLALPAVSTGPSPTDRLPAVATPLVGRAGEIATVLALLDQPDARLVTLLGPGGMGKTRLAIATGEELRRREPRQFQSGIVFVDLVAATDTEGLLLGIAGAVGFKPDGSARAGGLEAQLAAYLRERPYLLILDNLEQVRGAGTAISRLLGATTRPRLLATSRQRLNVAWEHVVSLPGLAFAHDAADDPASFPAGKLFLSRAARVLPGYELEPGERESLGQLCALVDGMPLALELAAGWVDTLRLDEIVAELRRDLGLLYSDLEELPQRHRSLRSVWDGTWQRLEPAEQAAFARLSVFCGGFTRGGAEAVASASLGTLGGLTGRYLIGLDRAAGRYRLHELLRQFAYEKLDGRGEADDILRRRFDYYLAFAADQERRLHGPEQADVQARFEADMDNLTATLDWSLGRPELADEAVALFHAVSWHWRLRAQITEGGSWSARLVANGGSPLARATALYLDGHFAWMRGDVELARERQLAAVQALAACDEEPQVVHLRAVIGHHLAMALHALGKPEEALVRVERSASTFRDLGDRWWLAFSLTWVDRERYALGDREGAAAARQEYQRLAPALGDPWLLIHALHHAEIAFAEGDLNTAREMALAAARYQAATGHLHSLGQSYVLLGRISRAEGNEAAAKAHFREAKTLFERIGHDRYVAEMRVLIGIS